MPRAYIDPGKCQKCAKCRAAVICPVKAIFRIDQEEPAVVETSLCHGCGDCQPECPAKAITIKP
jgi:MinD superfamily P-loop ATPase